MLNSRVTAPFRALAVATTTALALGGLTSAAVAEPGADPHQVAIADVGATEDTLSLFRYLRDQQGEGIIFGQQHVTDYGVTFDEPDGTASDALAVAGDYPGVFGFDTLTIDGRERPGVAGDTPEQNADALAQAFVDADALGGIVTLSAHFPNFATDGNYDDVTGRVVSQILPGGGLNEKYNDYLDLVARAALGAERGDGSLVPVIFRPFHENTGSWFWWGAAHATAGEYKEIFRYTVEYLRDVKGVHNFLYSFSPNGTFAGDSVRYLETYPGDQWVDVLGYDFYENSNATDNSDAWITSAVTDLAMVARLAEAKGKISAFTEFGRNGDRTIQPSGNKSLTFYTDLLAAIKADPDARKIAYMQTWANFGGGQIYVPAPADHEMAADFIEFADDEFTVFVSDLADPYALAASPIAHEAFARFVSPAGGTRVVTEPTTLRVKVSGVDVAALDEADVTLTVNGEVEPGLAWTHDGSGLLTATWSVGEDRLTNATALLEAHVDTVGSPVAAATVVLGAEPVLAPGVIDDFEGYGDDAALRASYTTNNMSVNDLSLADRGADGQGVAFAYDFTSSSYRGFGKAYSPAQNLSGFGELELFVGSDGSDHKLVVQLQAGGVTFEAYPSLAATTGSTVTIPWSDFAPAPWDTANAGQTLTWERLARVSQFFVYLNDGEAEFDDGVTRPRTGTIVLDDIRAVGEGEYYEPEPPSAEPVVVEDFESYADDAAVRAAWGNRGAHTFLSIVTEPVGSGDQAAGFDYDFSGGGWIDISRWLGGQDWSAHDRLDVWIDPNAQGQAIILQVSANGVYYETEIPLASLSGPGIVSLPFDTWTPAGFQGLDPERRPSASELANVTEFVIGLSQWDAETTTGTFYLDDVVATGGSGGGGEEPEVPDGLAEVLDDFESYADTAAVRAAWNNRGLQEWADGEQMALAPTSGKGGSKAGAFVFDFSERADLSEAQWVGPRNWAGLEGIGAWVNPNGSNHKLAFQVRTPAGAGGGEDWFWELSYELDGDGPEDIFLAFDDAVVSWPAGIDQSLRPTRAQLAGVLEFVVIALQGSGPVSGEFYLDDIRIGAAPDVTPEPEPEPEPSPEPEPEPEVAKPVITKQPKNVKAKLDKKATFSIKATGKAVKVQWQQNKAGTWRNIKGAKASKLKVTATKSRHGRKYRAVVSNAGGSVTSKVVKLSLTPAKPVIRTQPRKVTVKAGKKARFSIKVRSYPTAKVRWQLKRPGSKKWVNVAGARKSKLTIRARSTMNGYKYRAVAKNKAGQRVSKAVKLTVRR